MRGFWAILMIGSFAVIIAVLSEGVEGSYSLLGIWAIRGWFLVFAALAVLFGSVAAWLSRSGRKETTDKGLAVRPRQRSVVLAWSFVVLAIGIVVVGGRSIPLSVGDCFFLPEESPVSEVELVPCDESHDAEVYAVTLVPFSDPAVYPGLQNLFDTADTVCLAHFRPYVGARHQVSSLDYFYLVPSLESWEKGDQRMVCAVQTRNGAMLIGSVEGSGL